MNQINEELEGIALLDTRLRTFISVSERKSFSQSAQELYLTQSAVSQHIQSLEAYYGVKLFDRLNRRVQLTAAGEELYRYAASMQRQSQETEKTMRKLGDVVQGRLHIGASLTIGEYLLPNRLVHYQLLYPGVDISMEVFNTEQIRDLVISGQIDVGFIEGPVELPPSLEHQPWGNDELVLIAQSGHPVGTGPVSIDSLAEHNWILREPSSGTRKSFEAFLSSYGADVAALNVRMELGSTQAVKEAVKAGLGLAPISNLAVADELIRGDFCCVDLAEGTIRRDFTCIFHRNKFQSHATEIFLEFITK